MTPHSFSLLTLDPASAAASFIGKQLSLVLKLIIVNLLFWFHFSSAQSLTFIPAIAAFAWKGSIYHFEQFTGAFKL